MAWHHREYWKAQVDHCRIWARYWLDQKIGFGQVRRDLNTVISRDPSDAWALLDLARLETHFERTPRGQDLYRRAVLAFWKQGARGQAAQAFAEFFGKYLEVSFGLMPFELCSELIRQGRHEVAARLLEQFIREREHLPGDKNRAQVEKAYVLLAKVFASRLQLPDQAEVWLDRYLQKFPSGSLRDTAERMRHDLVRSDAACLRAGGPKPKLVPPLPA